MRWQCRLEVALAGGPWAMLRAPGPGPAAYDVRGRFAADAPRANFGSASRALTLRDVASACHKCVSFCCCGNIHLILEVLWISC